MNIKEMLSKMVKDNNTSYEKLAQDVGYANGSSIFNIGVRNNVSIDTLLKITNQLGYQIVLRPVAGDNKAERTIVIDSAGDVK